VADTTNICTAKPAACGGIGVQADCKAANVEPAPAAGCLWGTSAHGGGGNKCYTMIIQALGTDPAGLQCPTIGADQERCLVPGIEAAVGAPGVAATSCNWNGGTGACQR
jgi:hypothetical protein